MIAKLVMSVFALSENVIVATAMRITILVVVGGVVRGPQDA